jgi:predicted ATPase
LLLTTVRDSLGLPAGSDLPPQRQIAAALGAEPALLVLDNFEQLAGEGALRLQELRDTAPGLQFLVSSRVLLGLPGERELEVPPLRDDEAQELFFDRTGRCRDTNEYSEAVQALCHRLEGVPLAIELAAARATTLSPGEILERLEEKLDFLSSDNTQVPQRHRTLRAAIEWSFELLPEPLRRFFLDLCVFRDGWTLEAACAVCQVEEWEALDFLSQLRDHSLLLASEQSEHIRFRMLVMLREWAQQQLSGSELEALRARHFTYFQQLMEANRAPADIAAHSAQLIGELANFRAAMTWALERTDPGAAQDAAELCSALYGLWDSHSYYTVGREWIMQTLRKADEPTQKPLEVIQRANLTGSGGLTLWHCSEFETARVLLEESLQLARELGEEGSEAFPLYGLGRVAISVGQPEAGIAYAAQAVKIARQHGGPFQLMSCLTTLGWGYHNIERYAQMRDTFTECLHIAETIEARLFMGLSRTMIAFGWCNEKQPDRALPFITQALHDLQGCNNVWFSTFCQAVYGMVARAAGDLEAARFLSPRALRSFDRIGTRWEVASGLIDCGVLACELEDWPCAAHLFAASEALRESINHPMLRSIECHYLPARARLQAELEPEVLRREWEHGRALSVEEALLEADKLAGPPPEALLPLTVWPPL